MSRHDDVVDFGSLSERRKLALATFDLCAVCGKPFGQETRWQVSMTREALDHSDATFAEAPVHEICVLYSAQACPFVSSPYARLGDELRRGAKRPGTVYLVGYNHTSSVFGHPSRLQPGTGVLHFEMADRIGSHEFHTASEAAEIYRLALRGDACPSLDPDEQALVEILNHPTPENEDAAASWRAQHGTSKLHSALTSRTCRSCKPTPSVNRIPRSLWRPWKKMMMSRTA